MRILAHTHRTLSFALAFAGLAGVQASTLAAQSNTDTRWQAWLGCWQPTISAQQDPIGDGASAASAM